MKRKTISLLLPTRGRQKQCLKFLNSIANKASNPRNIEVILCVDDDDIASHDLAHDQLKTNMIIRPRQTMGKYNTDCLKASNGEIIFLVNDDIEVRTENWDENVLQMDAQYPDGIYLGYPNDLFKGRKQPTFPILSRKLCNLLIDPFPKSYKGSFIEYHLLDIFKRLEKNHYKRTHFLENTIFEHMHHRLGKGEFDETYKKRERFGDDLVFITETNNRKIQAKKIFSYLKGKTIAPGPPLKEQNLTGSPSKLLFYYLVETAFLDTQIPLRWRLFLLWWFPARLTFKLIKQLTN